jgi:hypothetical protein
VSLYCPLLTAQINAARNPDATSRLIPIKTTMTVIADLPS